MDQTMLKSALGAVILYGLVQSNTLFTIGGFLTALVIIAAVYYKPKPRRIYPKGQEPDAGEL